MLLGSMTPGPPDVGSFIRFHWEDPKPVLPDMTISVPSGDHVGDLYEYSPVVTLTTVRPLTLTRAMSYSPSLSQRWPEGGSGIGDPLASRRPGRLPR